MNGLKREYLLGRLFKIYFGTLESIVKPIGPLICFIFRSKNPYAWMRGVSNAFLNLSCPFLMEFWRPRVDSWGPLGAFPGSSGTLFGPQGAEVGNLTAGHLIFGTFWVPWGGPGDPPEGTILGAFLVEIWFWKREPIFSSFFLSNSRKNLIFCVGNLIKN